MMKAFRPPCCRSTLWPLVAGALMLGHQWPASADPTVPLEPIASIVNAFSDHTIVALGDAHGNIQSNDLRMHLIQDPAFQAAARDIVVEFGNSRYQEIIDRFEAGENVPEIELRKVWQDTAQANPVWDVPVYEQFYRAVRQVNQSLPPSRRLHVILGDVPIDWKRIKTLDDFRRQQRSDAVTVDIIRREVLAKGHRALLLFGEFHLLRRPLIYAPPPGIDPNSVRDFAPDPPSIVMQLEARGTRVFSIYTISITDISPLQTDIASWKPPVLSIIRGTPLGAAPFAAFNPTLSARLVTESGPVRGTVDVIHSPPMEMLFDAVVYLGPPSTLTFSLPSPDLCRDEAYLAMRFSRMELVGFGRDVERAKQYCRAVGQQSH